MQCKYCGHINNDNNKFCSFCGEKLEVEESSIVVEPTAEVLTIENNTRQYTARSIICIILYFVVFYFLTSIISSIVVAIFCANKGINAGEIENLNEYLLVNYPTFYYNFLATMNLLTYVALIASVVPILRKSIISDFKNAISNKRSFWKWFGIGIGILYGVSVASSVFINIILSILQIAFPVFKEINATSGNQTAINDLLSSGIYPLIVVIFMTTICAPILEELIFRKSFFNLSKKKGIGMIILSGAIFGSIHTVSSIIDILGSINDISLELCIASIVVELLNFISYFASGIALGLIYKKANYNIGVTMAVHSVYNAIGIILSILLMLLQ